jgi:D-threo-aldose 1-dehydrogenase
VIIVTGENQEAEADLMQTIEPTNSGPDQAGPGQPPLSPHALGFGCASLYGLPSRRDRRAVLETAYDLGIRHFDVAPMYGLGLAESELGHFIAARSDIIVATKFGIRPTATGRVAGLLQPPVRSFMRSFPAAKSTFKRSGSRRDAGLVGRILYSDHDYSVANARRALSASRRTLRHSRINYFLLHEPAALPVGKHTDLMEFLDSEVSQGTIEHWGPAGDLSSMGRDLSDLAVRAPAVQIPYDLINGHSGPYGGPDRRTIAFGFLSGTLPRVRTVLSLDSRFRQKCSELLDADLHDERTIVHLLVRNALTHNAFGTLLLSSTDSTHLKATCAGARLPLRNEAEVATLIRQKCLDMRV